MIPVKNVTTVKLLECCACSLMLQPPLPHYFLGALSLAAPLHFRLSLQAFLGHKPAFPSVQLLMQLRSDPRLQKLGLVRASIAYTDK